MVTGGENHHARELNHTAVQSIDGLHVQVVRRLIQHQHIGPGYHHLGQHAAHLLASGKDLHLFHSVLAGEQHTTQETADIGYVLLRGILGQPLYDGVVVVKLGAVVLGEIGL